jgi:hypothetical protein
MRENTLSGTVVEAAIALGRITVVDITRQAAEGTICGGEGSSHKGSHYTNPRTGDHYGRHQPGWPSHIRTPCAATPPSLWRFQDLGVWEARAVPHILMPPSKIAETIRNEKKNSKPKQSGNRKSYTHRASSQWRIGSLPLEILGQPKRYLCSQQRNRRHNKNQHP